MGVCGKDGSGRASVGSRVSFAASASMDRRSSGADGSRSLKDVAGDLLAVDGTVRGILLPVAPLDELLSIPDKGRVGVEAPLRLGRSHA